MDCSSRSLLGLLAVLLAGCPAGDDSDGATSGTPTSTETSTTEPTTAGPGGSSAAESTSASTMDDDAYCATFLDVDSCIAADFEGPGTCVWETIYVVSMDAGQCAVDQTRELCLATAYDATDPGCAGLPGCPTEPFFRTDGTQIETVPRCGSSPPNGFEPCTFVSEGVFEPAECVCLCEALAAEGM